MPPYLPDNFPSVLSHSEVGLSSYANEAHPSNGQAAEHLETIGEADPASNQLHEPLMQIIDKIANGIRVPPQISMQYEWLRFCTLRSYPKEHKPFITRIAQAGFYYSNSGDELVCYCCARRKSNWREDDVPMKIHRKLNPNCNFLLRNTEVNVPIKSIMPGSLPVNADQTTVQELVNESPAETTATSNTEVHNPSQTSTRESSTGSTSLQNSTEPSIPNLSDDGLLTSSARDDNAGANISALPKYPNYAIKNVRVASFNNHGDIVVPPDSLAESGFFYAGSGDCVRCFQCGVGLRNWSEDDDPWIEHSRWSKECAFARQMKGQEFVNLVQLAVQYSQNQSENGQTQIENTTDTNQEATVNGDIENLMHTVAAQSVLEIGYKPDIIRRAIRTNRDMNDSEILTATKLMQTIFELEDADSSMNNHQNPKPLQRSPSSVSTQSTPALQTVETNAVNNTILGQRADEVNSGASAWDDMSPASAQSERQITTMAESQVNTLVRSIAGKISTDILKIELSQVTCDLIRDNQYLRNQTYCIHCTLAPRNVLFLSCPCPHLILCHNCFMHFDRCPICDTKIKALMVVKRYNII